ncbi:MAG: hypothetical protein ACYC8T_10725 [Myxococcaceae bacterium]
MVESTCTLDGVTSREVRYFISSLDGTDAEKFARAVRTHWAVENKLHPDYLCHLLGAPNAYKPRLPRKGPRAAPK